MTEPTTVKQLLMRNLERMQDVNADMSILLPLLQERANLTVAHLPQLRRRVDEELDWILRQAMLAEMLRMMIDNLLVAEQGAGLFMYPDISPDLTQH